MEIKDYADKLKEVLDLEKKPVGVKYVERPPKRAEGRYPVCGAILQAAEGETISLSEETCYCPGGRRQ